jgi:hypothetical protein
MGTPRLVGSEKPGSRGGRLLDRGRAASRSARGVPRSIGACSAATQLANRLRGPACGGGSPAGGTAPRAPRGGPRSPPGPPPLARRLGQRLPPRWCDRPKPASARLAVGLEPAAKAIAEMRLLRTLPRRVVALVGRGAGCPPLRLQIKATQVCRCFSRCPGGGG